MDILYICDKKKECGAHGCFEACKHTSDPSHALNGACKRPWMYPERFMLDVAAQHGAFYVEIIREGKHEPIS